MRLNRNDFFESEETGLRIFIIPGHQTVILNFKGEGKFRTTVNDSDEIEIRELLSPPNTDRPPLNKSTIALLEIYFFTYITSFTALTTRSVFGKLAAINVGAYGSGTSAHVMRNTGASR